MFEENEGPEYVRMYSGLSCMWPAVYIFNRQDERPQRGIESCR